MDFIDLLILERSVIFCFPYLSVHWLILECALTRDQTHNLGLLGNALTELPGQGQLHGFLNILCKP